MAAPPLRLQKIPGEKARLEQRKDALCCFEQILDAAHDQASSVRPLTFHLTNHTRFPAMLKKSS